MYIGWSLTSDVQFDPVDVRANPCVHRERIYRATSARHPGGRAPDDPFSIFQAGQGSTAVAVTYTTSISSNANHRTLVYSSPVRSSTLIVAYHWNFCLFEFFSKHVVGWINAAPSC